MFWLISMNRQILSHVGCENYKINKFYFWHLCVWNPPQSLIVSINYLLLRKCFSTRTKENKAHQTLHFIWIYQFSFIYDSFQRFGNSCKFLAGTDCGEIFKFFPSLRKIRKNIIELKWFEKKKKPHADVVDKFWFILISISTFNWIKVELDVVVFFSFP